MRGRMNRRRRGRSRRREAVRGVYYAQAPYPRPGMGFVALATVDGKDIRNPMVTKAFFPPWVDSFPVPGEPLPGTVDSFPFAEKPFSGTEDSVPGGDDFFDEADLSW